MQWPFVGREDELGRILRLLGRRGAPVVAIEGGPGVGKTRLGAEAATAAADQGWAVERFVATRSTVAIPYGPFARLVPPSAGSPAAEVHLLRDMTAAVKDAAASHPLLVAVDDAHLLDDASAAFVHHLVTEKVAALLLTLRAAAPMPDAVRRLVGDDGVHRILLTPLTESATEHAVSEALGGPVAPSTLRRLHRLSAGNPLYLRLLVLDGEEAGWFHQRDGVWHGEGDVRPRARLTDLITARLDALSLEERRLVELVAFAEPVGLRIAEALEPAVALDQLARAGLIVLERSGRRDNLRLGHPLYAELIRASMPELVLRGLGRRLTTALQATGARRADDALKLAAWSLEAGVPIDADVLLAAADRASFAADHALAEKLARRALDVRPTFHGAVVLGRCLHRQERWLEASAVLAAQEHAATTDEARTELLAEQLLVVLRGLRRPDLAHSAAVRALTQLKEPSSRAYVLALDATVLTAAGEPSRALDTIGYLLGKDMAEATGGERLALLRSLPGTVPSLVMLGRTDQALALSYQGLSMAVELSASAPDAVNWAGAGRSIALIGGLRLGEAEQLLEGVLAMSDPARDDDFRGSATMLLARIALDRGQAATAARMAREAIRILRERDHEGHLPWSLAVLAMASALLDDDAGVAALDEVPDAVLPVYKVEVDRAEGWRLAHSGQLTAAGVHLVEVGRHAINRGQVLQGAAALHDAFRLGETEGARDLQALAETLDAPWLQLYASHVDAALAGDGAALIKAAEDFADLGLVLHASEAAGAASQLFKISNHPASAASAGADAARWMAACEGAQLPGSRLPGAPADPAAGGLTRRQREVVELAAKGMSNNEIASLLVVSVRTVEGHLYQAFARLGITDRAELANLR